MAFFIGTLVFFIIGIIAMAWVLRFIAKNKDNTKSEFIVTLTAICGLICGVAGTLLTATAMAIELI